MDDSGFADTPPMRVHAAVHVEDGTLVVDLTGSHPQVESAMNVPISEHRRRDLLRGAGIPGP